jgi:hypothetical protein
VGVGVPLGVALLLAVTWALWERSKKSKGVTQYAGPAEIDGSGMQYSNDSKNGVKQQGYGSELGGNTAHELQ